MSSFKRPTTKNTRNRLTLNASESRIAEANEVWHSTAIEEGSDDSAFGPGNVTPIRGTQPAKATSGKRKASDSGRGGSSTREHCPVSSDDDCGRGQSASPCPVVINPPSGHGFLSSVLQRCGYIIRQPATNNEMFHDVMKFRKTLGDWIEANDPEMCRIETDTSKFKKALHAYLSVKSVFITAMKPTKHETELILPSLLHCLLGIEALQQEVLAIVFLFLSEASLSNTQEDTLFVNTILNQLKWLPTIVNGQKFADSLLSIVETGSTGCESQMIKFLPDILPANLHSQVAPKLLEKFSDEKSNLNIALMDCFSALDIAESYWANIWDTAIDQMANASLQDIPAYFSFLFQSETLGALSAVITAIREKVTLEPPQKRTHKMDAYQVEILEKVEFCVTVNPSIAKLWTKHVKDDFQHSLFESIKKIDLLMLFIFADSDKSATTTLKMLFTEKKLTLNLIDELMKHNTPMVYQLFTTISKFLDSLLRGRDTKCLETVCDMSVKLFLGLSVMEAQTLMGNMTSILVNFPPSRETVLQMLTNLAEKDPKKLLNFAPYLMGVLEYVMQFPAGQIRSLMNVLAILSQTEGRNPGESNHFSAEFSILLRKQLTHSDIKIRCFGVFGAMASVRKMAAQSTPNVAQIRQLFELAWSFVERDEDACSIFLDELSTCVSALPMDICKTYRDILLNKFQQLWTMDAGLNQKIKQFGQKNGLNLNLVPEFDANKECTQDRLLINFENHPMSMSPLVVPAHLRVLSLLEHKVSSGSLVGIDAIIGCPLLFPCVKEFYDRDSISVFPYPKRAELGRYLVLAINFFRESICAFIEDGDSELRVKIWHRLESILKLQKMLVRHYDSFPVLPYAYVEDKTIGSSKDGVGAGPSGLQLARMASREKYANKPGASGGKKKEKAAPKKSSKKKPRTDTLVDLDSGEDEEQAERDGGPAVQQHKKSKVPLDEEIQPKKIHHHLRRLDARVFQLLRFPLRCDGESVDFSRVLLNLSAISQNPNSLRSVEKFTPDTLALLLLELKRQVDQRNAHLEILSVKRLLRFVCTHISDIQNVILSNEENEMASVTENGAKLEICLRILIGIMTAYFEAIKKLDKNDKERAIQKSVRILSTQGRNAEEVAEPGSQTEAMAHVSSYLGGFVSIIKDSATALDHMKLLKNLHDLLEGNGEIKKAIGQASQVYLRNEWKLPSAQVDGFLKIWMGTSPSSIKVIKGLVTKLLPNNKEQKNKDKGASSEEEDDDKEQFFNSSHYKSCTAINFHTWYAAMVQGLSQYSYKNLRRRGDFVDSIREWVDAVSIFQKLVGIVKLDSRKSKTLILSSLLRHCRMFLESFIAGGAELLPQFWKEDQRNAQSFCKSLQLPCRTIQHICEHSKLTTDLQLLKSVPLVKRVLETLVFRVREVLAVHGAVTAFTLGTLKHRDLQGEEIGSQIMRGGTQASFVLDDDDDNDDEEEEEAAEVVEQAALSGLTVDDVNEDSMDAELMDLDEDD